jgi:membrane protease YdiL (CAAX protease family)
MPRWLDAGVAAAWIAFMVALCVDGTVHGPTSFVLAGLVGAVIVGLGFAAASRCRSVPRRSAQQRTRLALLSLAAGAGVGLLNLAANWGIAQADPALRALLIERMSTLQPAEALIASPMMEEVVFRLFVMGVMAWVVSRFTNRSGLAFAVALIGSTVIFALLHLGRPFPDRPALSTFYSAALMTKYTLLSLPLGWVFWRWGLPYAILCHIAGNATHIALQWAVF